MIKKQTILYIFLCITITTFAGCVGTFNYPKSSNMVVEQGKPHKETVAVQIFQDKRPTVGHNWFWIGYIPLMPFGEVTYNRPGEGTQYLTMLKYNFDPVVDLTNAADMSLTNSNLFKHVSLAYNNNEAKKSDYVFSGTIYSTLYTQKNLTYFISFPSTILQLLGAPRGITTCELNIKFYLKDTKTDKIIWSHTTEYEKKEIVWIYTPKKEVKDFPIIMRKSMNEAMNNLTERLNNNSGLFHG
ncbi:MAG: hypothetical protein GY756_01290 [bacterium]|nr:hypothetical protein [bacterium]